MEKLGKWRDPSTGINPFIHRQFSIFHKILLTILGLFRLPLGISLYLIFVATEFKIVRKFLLYVSGINQFDLKECIYQNEIIRPFTQGKLSAPPSHCPGDIVICNSVVGWLDRLVLKAFFPEGLYRFPELCPSNNRGVLQFDPNLVLFGKKNERVRLVSLRYDPVPHTAWWIFPACKLAVRTLSPEAIWESSIELDSPEFPFEAQKLVALLGHLKPLKLSYQDYIEYEKNSAKSK
jgi:hypothetical protein